MIAINKERRYNNYNYKLCFGIASGGGTIISQIAATSGASSLLLEGTVTYDRHSYQTYIRTNSATSTRSRSSSSLNDNDKDNDDDNDNDKDNKKKFSYSSMDAARLASMSSLWRGLELQVMSMSSDDNNTTSSVIGIGSESTLQTNTVGGTSKTGRSSFGNIVITTSMGQQITTRFTLPSSTESITTRFQQDLMVSHLICHTIEQIILLEQGNDGNDNNDDDDNMINDQFNTINEEYIIIR